jgi:tetratricopeptide (TPR) repeat protein
MLKISRVIAWHPDRNGYNFISIEGFMVDISSFLITIAKTLPSYLQIKHNRHDIDIFMKEAMSCINNGNFDMAVGYINAAIKKSTSDEEELSSLYLIKSAALIGEIAESNEVVLTNLPDAPIGTLPGSLEAPTGKISRLGNEALESIEVSITLNPRNALAYYFKGFVFFSLSELKESVRAFDDALKIGLPEDLQFFAYKMRGRLYLVLDQYDDARKCYENLLRLDPTNNEALVTCEVIKKGLPVIVSWP